LALVAAAPLTSGTGDGTPHLSLDGRSLYFYSDRSTSGSEDLFVATRADTNSPFDTVTELSSLNSPGLDHLPWISADERTIYFASDRAGSVDIWRATRGQASDAFAAPNAVDELNTTSDEGGIAVSADQREVIFVSSRAGGLGGPDFYRAVRASVDEPFSAPVHLPELSSTDLDYGPELTRDGSALYFASRRGDTVSAIWRVRRSCP